MLSRDLGVLQLLSGKTPRIRSSRESAAGLDRNLESIEVGIAKPTLHGMFSPTSSREHWTLLQARTTVVDLDKMFDEMSPPGL